MFQEQPVHHCLDPHTIVTLNTSTTCHAQLPLLLAHVGRLALPAAYLHVHCSFPPLNSSRQAPTEAEPYLSCGTCIGTISRSGHHQQVREPLTKIEIPPNDVSLLLNCSHSRLDVGELLWSVKQLAGLADCNTMNRRDR
jgi:hypothetical protein